MTFWRALKATCAGSLAFIAACPMLALVPVLFELLQHVVEVRDGMYDSVAGFRAAAEDPVRLGFGAVKIVFLTVTGYWVNRFLASRDPIFTRRADGAAWRLFGGYLVFQLASAAVQLFVLPRGGGIAVVTLAAGLLVTCLVMPWGVAASLGNANVGPQASALIMVRRLPWTVAFALATLLPLLVPHYVIASQAIGRGAALWPLLVVDSLLVGGLTTVIAASGYFAGLRAATAAGVRLVPLEIETRSGPAARGALASAREAAVDPR